MLKDVLRIMRVPALRPVAAGVAHAALKNFFVLQYRESFRHSIPVSRVDCPLDQKIPFVPSWAKVYGDFTAFWIRSAVYLLDTLCAPCGLETAVREVGFFLRSHGELYTSAGEVYRQNLSTTKRPRYFGSLGFVIIHIADPHLLCVPSLHVMLVIHCALHVRRLLARAGLAKENSARIEEADKRALLICESILYMKQHSINCVAASLYALCCLENGLFGRKEAESFIASFLADDALHAAVPPSAREEIREHIASLSGHFMLRREALLASGNNDWTLPLVEFLRKPACNP
jgi:hypothetical protein